MSEHRWPIHPRAGRVDALCLCLVVLCGALLLAGCAVAPKAESRKQKAEIQLPPPVPSINPKIQQSSSEESTIQDSTASDRPATHTAMIAPAPNKVMLSWQRNDMQPGTRTEVWASPTLAPWQPVLITNTATESVTLPMAEQMYFIVRNRNGELVSEWNK